MRPELQKELVGFIKDLVSIIHQPQCWPLSREDQASFVRSTLYKAQRIHDSEKFHFAALEITTSDLVKELPKAKGKSKDRRKE